MTIIYAKLPDGTYSAHGYMGEYDSAEALIDDLAEYYRQRGEEVEFREDDLRTEEQQ